jgi:hypothetical protein
METELQVGWVFLYQNVRELYRNRSITAFLNMPQMLSIHMQIEM